jgi:glycosyltransferase involved in cell wall biosynthesis
MPQLSVIVPVYNTAHYLQECVDSILSQRFADLELLLVDDGSTDKSGDICDQNAAADPRVHVFHQRNSGVSAARNTGIGMAKGEWICFIDSDDYIEDGYLDVPFEKNVDLLVRNWCLVGADPKDYCPPTVVSEDTYWDYMKANMRRFRYRTVAGLFLRRSIVADYAIRFDRRFRLGEDTLFMMDYLAVCRSLIVLDGASYRYRQAESWQDKYRLKWEDTQLYFQVFWEKYDRFPVPIPELVVFIFTFFRSMTNPEGLDRKWAYSAPVFRYRKQLLSSKGIKFKIHYWLDRVVSRFIYV